VIVFAGGVALLGGGITWVATKKVDVSDPNAASAFASKFEAGCTKLATGRIDKNDYQKITLVKQVCACDGKALVAYMRRNKDMTVLQLERKIRAGDEAIRREFSNCNKAYGIEVVPD
jgi:hypothetical protein